MLLQLYRTLPAELGIVEGELRAFRAPQKSGTPMYQRRNSGSRELRPWCHVLKLPSQEVPLSVLRFTFQAFNR